MDDRTPAEALPQLYRAVLDNVVRLEHAGEREAAWRIRRDALRAYSTRWDERGRKSLERLNRDAQGRLSAVPNARRSTVAATASTEPA